MHALERATECAHAWEEVCAVYHRRLGVEGTAVRCSICERLGFQKANKKPMLVDGREIFQAEYRNGRPSEVWDAHL